MKKSFLVYRVCTFMLCLVQMLVIFPISVFAAKDMFTTYQIDDVTITGIDTPTAGKTFDFTAEEASQKYNIIKVAWREQNGSNYITSTSSTASAGKNYTVYVVLEVATANHYFNTDSSRRPAVSSVTVSYMQAASGFTSVTIRAVSCRMKQKKHLLCCSVRRRNLNMNELRRNLSCQSLIN